MTEFSTTELQKLQLNLAHQISTMDNFHFFILFYLFFTCNDNA